MYSLIHFPVFLSEIREESEFQTFHIRTFCILVSLIIMHLIV